MDPHPAPDAILKILLEALHEGIAAVDAAGRVIFVNRALAKLLGFSEVEDLPQLELQEALQRIQAYTEDGELLPEEQRPLLRALRGETVVDVPITMRMPLQNRSFNVINSALPVRGPDGKVCMAVLRMLDVTEQVRTFRELEKSQDRYKLATSAIEAMVYDWDVASGRVERSEALEKILGFRPAEAEPTVDWWRARIHEDDVSPARSQVEYQLAVGAERHFAEYRIKHRDGRWITVADRGIAIFDAKGRAIRVVGSTVDITYKKQAGQALRESNARFAKAFQLVPVAVAISTLDEGRYLDVNATLLNVTGYARDEIVGRTALELGVYANPADHRRVRDRLAADNAVEGLEVQLRGKAGDIRTSLVSADVIELSGEQCLLSASIDITERKRAETALSESEERYRALVENASDIVATLDLDFRITSVNAAVERVLGYCPREIVGARLSDVIAMDQEFGASAGSYEVRARAKDTGRIVALEVRASILRDEAARPTALHVIARDITERKHAEARQMLLMRELQHRTKNILAVVQSLVTNTLSNAATLGQASDALVGRLHAIATAQEFVTVDAGGGAPLATLVEGELAAFRSRVRIEGEQLFVGSGFAQIFTLIVHELVTNAAKYGALSAPKGRIDISWNVTAGEQGEMFNFAWTESGGPRVALPSRFGFGRKIIGLLGQPTLQFRPEGLRFRLALPLADLQA